MTSGRTYYQVLWHEYSSHNLDDVHGVMNFTYASREIKNLPKEAVKPLTLVMGI